MMARQRVVRMRKSRQLLLFLVACSTFQTKGSGVDLDVDANATTPSQSPTELDIVVNATTPSQSPTEFHVEANATPPSQSPTELHVEANETTPSPSPTESPTMPLNLPNLPFGDINVVFTTDVHSWIAGHGRNEPNWNADYGDILSFYLRLKEHCSDAGRDLWFVMNGDWIDGTGLATDGDPSSLVPLLQKMPWDAVNVGNHELYHSEVIEFITRPGGFVPWWGDRYLSSNVVKTESQEPLGNRYHVLRGRSNLLTFGFLYNMKNNADVVTVFEVETVLRTKWFKKALHSEAFDAVLVLAHMDVNDDLLDLILGKIRSELGEDVPVQFITGHTHTREYSVLDKASTSAEAGRFLDTVGFVSFPTKETLTTRLDGTSANVSDFFKHVFLDTNVDVLREAVNVDSLATGDGQMLSNFILQTREKLGLTELVSCIPQTYKVDSALNESDSLWGFFRDKVVPSQFRDDDIVFLSRGEFRYDLFAGDVIVDDIYALSPFDSDLVALRGLPSSVVLDLNASLNNETPWRLPFIPTYVLSPANRSTTFDNNATYRLITDSFGLSTILEALPSPYPQSAINRTTTTIWMDFFKSNDLCNGRHSNRNRNRKGNHTGSYFGGDGVSSMIDAGSSRGQIFFATFALIVVSGMLLILRRRWQSQKGPYCVTPSAAFNVLNEADFEGDSDEDELL